MLNDRPGICSLWQLKSRTYIEQYSQLCQQHWWWQARAVIIGQVVAKTFAEKPKPEILDVGCGAGVFWDKLPPGSKMTGLEPDPLLGAQAAQRGRVIPSGWEKAEIPDATYDGLLLLDVLEHLTDEVAALQKARRVLKPGGFLILTVPALMLLWSQHDLANGHVKRYVLDEMAPLLKRTGFKIVQKRYLFSWFVPAFFMRKILLPPQKNTNPNDLQYSVSIPSAPVNALLKTIALINTRVDPYCPLPWGSSLLVCAQAV